MATKSFGVKELKIDGSGTPTIESPSGGNLNITAGKTVVSGNMSVAGNQIDFTNIPTSNPNIDGRLWREGTDLKISTG